MVDAVLFDLDGTFADTAPDLGEALNHVLKLRGLPALPLATIRPQASHGSPGLLKLGLGIGPDSPDYAELRDAFLKYYEAHICDRTKLFAGMAALIAELEERDLPWGIVTNKPHRYTVPLMEKLGYAKRASMPRQWRHLRTRQATSDAVVACRFADGGRNRPAASI